MVGVDSGIHHRDGDAFAGNAARIGIVSPDRPDCRLRIKSLDIDGNRDR
jgi:hypothetical protein